MRSLQSLTGHIRLNEPLPWDVLDSRGQLLLGKGYILTDAEQLEALVERGLYVDRDDFDRRRRDSPPRICEEFDPFWRWEALFKRLALTLREQVADPGFVDNVSQIAEEIDQLTDRDCNAAIFAMVRLDVSLYPIAHALRTAFVGGLVARATGMSDAQRLVLLKAALTMNIAIIELQKTLYKQSDPLTDQQRAEIKLHPILGWQRLEAFGVRDEEWLGAVAQHHEMPDGKGYPAGLTDISPIADVISCADRYCAMTCGRLYRKALPPNEVARILYLAATSETPTPILLIKKLGIYPPGSYVKLANGDTAIVTRCGESVKAPQVYSLQDRTGVAHVDPVRRDTALPDFSIVDSVPSESVLVQINPLKLFGYEK
jgi:hypothetical protein